MLEMASLSSVTFVGSFDNLKHKETSEIVTPDEDTFH